MLDDLPYDWAYEYQSRIRALRVFERRSVERLESEKRVLRPKPASDEAQVQEPRFDYTGALEALLSTLHSAMPVPPPSGGDEQRHPWEDPSVCTLRLRQAAERAPAHPPHFNSTQEPPKPQSTTTAGAQAGVPHFIPPSKNIAFLKRVFSLGVIPDLLTNGGFGLYMGESISNSSLSASSESSGYLPSPSSHRYATSERDALNQLIAVLGVGPFLTKPSASTPDDTLAALQDAAAHPEPNIEDTLYRPRGTPLDYPTRAAAQMFSRIRLAAQAEVYNMRYLHPRRAYGPFLRVPLDGTGDDPSDEEDDAADEDFVPPPDGGDDSDSDASDDDGPADLGRVRVFLPVTPHAPRPPPAAAELRADWEHLAAIRIVVQARMEEAMRVPHGVLHEWFQPGRLDDLRRTLLSWENVRAGVWSAGPVKSVEASEDEEAGGSSTPAQESIIPMSPSEPLVEWDWAGVQGVWRYVVMPFHLDAQRINAGTQTGCLLARLSRFDM